MNRKSLLSAAALVVSGVLASLPVSAETYPSKPVRVFVPSGAGSAPDLIARMLGDKVGRALGQPFIIENRPGAGGIINMNALRQSAADGYTLTLIQGAIAAVTPYTYKEANFDVERDFEVIGTVATTPMLFVATANFPAKTFAEAIDMAKSKPESISLASSTRGSIPHLTNEYMSAKTGAKFQLVPFPTSSAGIQATVGGQVQMFTDGVAPLLPLVKAGRLKALAVASDTPLPGLEGIPLAKDTVPGLNMSGWFVVLAPKGTPREIVTKLNAEINEMVKLPDVVNQLREMGSYPKAGTPASAVEFIKSEKTLFGGIVRSIGLQPE